MARFPSLLRAVGLAVALFTAGGGLPASAYTVGPIAPVTDLFAPMFGNGSDGAVTCSGANTLTRNMNYTTLTAAAGCALKTNGFMVFTWVLDISAAPAGAFQANGIAGNNASGAAGGTGGASAYTGAGGSPVTLPGIGGFNGGTGGTGNATTGTNPTASGSGTNFGAGGTSATGATGGNGVSAGATGGTTLSSWIWATSLPPLNYYQTAFIAYAGGNSNNPLPIAPGAFGGAGGQGGGDGTFLGGGGGGAPGGGGWLAIYARTIVRGSNATAAIFQAKGGIGGNGGAATGGNAGGGGAATGAGGGAVYLCFETLLGSTIANAIDVSGGNGGVGGNGVGTGIGGGGGKGGNSGSVQKYQIGSPGSYSASTFNQAGAVGGAASGVTGGTSGAGATLQVGL